MLFLFIQNFVLKTAILYLYICEARVYIFKTKIVPIDILAKVTCMVSGW